jgi:hypothetical protein
MGLFIYGTSKAVIEIALDFQVKWWFTNKNIRRGFLGARDFQGEIECEKCLLS